MLLGFAGFSGSGKTTAVNYLHGLLRSEIVYLGEVVLDEVKARGLAITPDNEAIVRDDLRNEHGPLVILDRRMELIRAAIRDDKVVLLDAVYHVGEYECLKRSFPTEIVAILASNSARMERVKDRESRAMSAEALAERDAYEAGKLQTDRVFQAAHQVSNEGTFKDLHSSLDALKRALKLG